MRLFTASSLLLSITLAITATPDKAQFGRNPEPNAERTSGDSKLAFENTSGVRPDPNGPVVFTRVGNRLHMTGTLDQSTRGRLQNALQSHPDVTTIVMMDVPGSIDDEGAISAYRLVRERGLNTHIPADGVVASGGVDFFCAGVRRTADPGSKILVHPWSDDSHGRTVTGDRFPRNHPFHRFYLDYYTEMGVAQEFYWHTLTAPRTNVSLADGTMAVDMHEMTAADLNRFRVVTGGDHISATTVNDTRRFHQAQN